MPLTVLLPKPVDPADDVREPLRAWMLVLSAVVVLLCAAAYVYWLVSVPGFEALFRGFGDELPWLTRAVLAGYRLGVLPVLIAVIPFTMLLRHRVDYRSRHWRRFKWVLIGFGLTWTLMGIGVVAMYLPIFRMGTAVS